MVFRSKFASRKVFSKKKQAKAPKTKKKKNPSCGCGKKAVVKKKKRTTSRAMTSSAGIPGGRDEYTKYIDIMDG